MTTVWRSGEKKSTNDATSKNTISGTMLTSWSRQQKLTMIASLALLGLLLAVSACSKESARPALVSVAGPASSAPAVATTPAMLAATAPAASAKTRPHSKKRPANVIYSDANSGVSFLYPRKFSVTSGDKVQPDPTSVDMDNQRMNFVQPGGVAVAMVTLPAGSYPGTDFASAFFKVNINRNVSEQECSHFAFVDSRNADGEPVEAEKVKVGTEDMEMTSEFAGGATKQAETQYYHNYENGSCYEYVLGLGTAGYGTKDSIEPVNRDEVFAKLQKILATLKIKPAIEEPGVETASGIAAGKE